MFTLLQSGKCLFAVALIFTSQIGGQYSAGNKLCDHPSGDPARCMPMSQCQEATILIKRGFRPTPCKGHYEDVVCCKDVTTSRPQMFLIPSETQTEGMKNSDSPKDTGPYWNLNLPNDNLRPPAIADNSKRWDWTPHWPIENSVTACARYKGFAPSVQLSSPTGLLLERVEEDFRKRVCVRKSVPFIISGVDASPKEFPHMALLGYSGSNGTEWNCGGSLISEYFVLTAAHCTATIYGSPVVVRLGEHSLMSPDGLEPKDYAIADIVIHSEYQRMRLYNDIALLRLKERVFFSHYIRPACLPPKNFNFSSAIATGWGLKSPVDGGRSDVLQKVELSPQPNSLCRKEYRAESYTDKLYKGIDEETQLCYGGARGKDSSQGDSGGPLQVAADDNCNYFIVGVTSFGKSFVNRTTFGVYTRVQHYLDWIEGVVWPDTTTIPIVF